MTSLPLMKIEFEANVQDFNQYSYNTNLDLTFTKPDRVLSDSVLKDMKCRRFKVTLEEIKEW